MKRSPIKCFVFSIGEKTTDLCCELMKEYGFEVILYQDETTLWQKLKRFYEDALQTKDDVFVRIDADIIPNRNVIKLIYEEGWTCASGFDWYSQDRRAISIHVMSRRIVRSCLKHINEANGLSRPETYLWRLKSVNPHTYVQESFNCGIHGYGQWDQRERIKQLKHNRNQPYDWDLIERIEALHV